VLEELLQFLYLSPVGVVKFQASGAVDLMNPVATALLLSMSPTDTLANIYAALAPMVPELRELVARFAGPAGIIMDQHWLRACAGSRTLVLSLTVNQIKENIYMAVLTDVTTLAEQNQKLYSDRQKFFAIFDHVLDYAIYTITMDGIVEEWNQSVQRFAGWLAADVQGRSMALFFPADDADKPCLDLLLAEAGRLGSVETEGWGLKRDGSRLWANTVITALPNEAGTVCGFVVVSRDMTERKRREDDMKLLATVDPLTGAYNRRQGDALLAAESGRRARDGRPFAVLLMDIDHFKAVNDLFGHLTGDAVLCALVKACRNALRTIDVVVRWGGEEFLVIMPDADTAAAMSAAERVRATLASTEITAPGAGASIRITVSIGVAVPTDDSPVELMRRSDVALYSAKTGGRNRVMLAP
jgi:diguanylate cyclase (GGDEF)-like protein/PAS domain S-box-containing protein